MFLLVNVLFSFDIFDVAARFKKITAAFCDAFATGVRKSDSGWLAKLACLLDGAVAACVEINQCVGCTRQFFTKSFLGDDAAVLARSSGEEPASPRHRAGVASMA